MRKKRRRWERKRDAREERGEKMRVKKTWESKEVRKKR